MSHQWEEGGEDSDRLSEAMIFSLVCDRRGLIDSRQDTIHNLSDRDEKIQWDAATLPPFSLCAHTQTHKAFFFLLWAFSSIIYHLFYVPIQLSEIREVEQEKQQQ